jgi:hypothetical protein
MMDVEIPVEIWDKIFSHAAQDVDNSLDVTHHPWTTSQVCQQWRNVCHNLPHLWTELKLPALPRTHLSCIKHRLTTRLQHTQDQPLSITMSVGGQPLEVEETYMNLLYPRRDSWGNLTLAVRSIGETGQASAIWDQLRNCEHIARSPKPQYPKLRQFNVASYRSPLLPPGASPNIQHNQTAWGFFFAFSLGHCPSLTRVTMRVPISNGSYLPAPQFPWHQLEEFSVSAVREEFLGSILCSLFNIITLTLDLLGTRDDGPSSILVNELNTLQTLRVLNIPDLILPQIAAPRLKSLITSQQPLALPNLISFIRRSDCHLVELVITIDEEVEVEELLTMLPELRKISISQLRSNTFNRIILGLHPAIQSSSRSKASLLCPHLITLTLNELSHPSDLVTNEPALSPDHLADMIETRWKTPKALIDAGTHSTLQGAWMSLNHKRLDNWGGTHIAAVARLKMMLSQGLDIDFITTGSGQIPFLSLIKGTVAQTTQNVVR